MAKKKTGMWGKIKPNTTAWRGKKDGGVDRKGIE